MSAVSTHTVARSQHWRCVGLPMARVVGQHDLRTAAVFGVPRVAQIGTGNEAVKRNRTGGPIRLVFRPLPSHWPSERLWRVRQDHR